MKVSIKAIPIVARDLQPGDLFSTEPQIYWDKMMIGRGVGEMVYIRTNQPCPDGDDVEFRCFKLEIIQEV